MLANKRKTLISENYIHILLCKELIFQKYIHFIPLSLQYNLVK